MLERALSIDPTPYVRRALTLIQVDSGQYEAAIENARLVIEQDPTLPWTQGWLGRALYLSGRLEDSLRVLQAEKDEAHYLGYLYGRLGRQADAEAMAVRYADAAGTPDVELCRIGRPGEGVRCLRARRHDQLAAGRGLLAAARDEAHPGRSAGSRNQAKTRAARIEAQSPAHSRLGRHGRSDRRTCNVLVF